MSGTHTPGPWTVARNYRDKLAVVGPKNDGTTTNVDRICNLPHRANGEGPANARLIAKAPEMREALAAAIEVLDAEGIVYGNCDQEPLDVLSNARALLAEIDGNG